jgi:hypothetical protein
MIYINQALRQYFTTGIDDSTTSSVVLKYRDPLGQEGEKTATLVESDEGKYYSEWQEDELNQVGTWTFWSYVTTIDGGVFPGNPWQDVVQTEGDYPVNKDYIKSFLGITDTSQDDRIDAMIPVLIEQYEQIRNAPFDFIVDSDGNKTFIYPESLPAVISQMMEYVLAVQSGGYKQATSEKIGSYSVSYGGSDSYPYPQSIMGQIKRFVRGQ